MMNPISQSPNLQILISQYPDIHYLITAGSMYGIHIVIQEVSHV